MKPVYLMAVMLLVVLTLPGAADTNSGLVAHYPLNGDAVDATGNGRDGTVFGATPTADRFGNPAGAYQFDGNDYIVASAEGLPTIERTVALWFRLDTVTYPPYPVLFAYGGCGCGTNWFEYVKPGVVGVFPHCSGGMSCSYNVFTGYWYQLVFTTTSAGTWMYVDGELVCSSPVVMNTCTNAGTHLAIGVCVADDKVPYTDYYCGYTNGAIDEVRIYNRALSAADIQEICDCPSAPAWIQNPGNGNYYRLTEGRYWGVADEYANTNLPTWLDAEAEAQTYGQDAHLVTINDADENQWLVSTFGESERWIGFTDHGSVSSEGSWVWISGEPVTFTNWDAGQPDNGMGGEDCAHLNHGAHIGSWNDLGNQYLSWHPDLPLYAIVEKPTPPDVSAVPTVEPRGQLCAAPSVLRSSTQLRFGRSDRPMVLVVADVRGSEVLSIPVGCGVTEVLWSGCDAHGRPVASGVYWAVLTGGQRLERTKIVVVR